MAKTLFWSPQNPVLQPVFKGFSPSFPGNDLWAVYTSISETTQVGRGNPHLLIIYEFPLTKIDSGNIMST